MIEDIKMGGVSSIIQGAQCKHRKGVAGWREGLLALKMEGGTTRQGMWVTSRSWTHPLPLSLQKEHIPNTPSTLQHAHQTSASRTANE